ncbi:MAG: ATP synthase subunit I, partial [Acidobacteriota bacterium]
DRSSVRRDHWRLVADRGAGAAGRQEQVMFQISIERIKRFTLVLGVVGTVLALVLFGWREAVAFLVGSALAMLTIDSWTRVAASLNPEAVSKPSAKGSAVFLALRYLLIAAAMYGTIKVLEVTPVAMLLGLLVSFGAVLIEILQQISKKQ